MKNAAGVCRDARARRSMGTKAIIFVGEEGGGDGAVRSRRKNLVTNLVQRPGILITNKTTVGDMKAVNDCAAAGCS